jgi:hypothetical protein
MKIVLKLLFLALFIASCTKEESEIGIYNVFYKYDVPEQGERNYSVIIKSSNNKKNVIIDNSVLNRSGEKIAGKLKHGDSESSYKEYHLTGKIRKDGKKYRLEGEFTESVNETTLTGTFEIIAK